MLRYFYQNKLKYEKGQLAPFFIVLLVIIIIMAMVTVNLSKVAFIKTESANAADAGGLAAGSVMANLFNAIGEANRQMERAYWNFFERISLMFVMVIEYLVSGYIDAYYAKWFAVQALEKACSSPCQAYSLIKQAIWYVKSSITNIEEFIIVIQEHIKPEVNTFYRDQFDFYQRIRQTCREGHCKAIKMGHRLSFMNSGIGEKLRDRARLSNFLATLDCQNPKIFPWVDGQARAHEVESKVSLDPVDKFELKVTQNTYSQELIALNKIMDKANLAIEFLYAVLYNYRIAKLYLLLACILPPFCVFAIPYLKEGIALNNAVLYSTELLLPLFTDVPTAWAKLLPREKTFFSETDTDAEDQIICWIEEIVHNRKVRVDNWQRHQGATEPGIWQTRYPEIQSFSIVNFEGKGQIHRLRGENTIEGPVLRHNPSIIETDNVE